MIVDGGLVQKCVKFPKQPGKPDSLAIKGVWSGGTWSPNTNFTLQQYRNQQFIRFWKVIGVDLITRPTIDTVLLMELDTPNPDLAQDDILVFGLGAFTLFTVKSADLPWVCTSAVQVGSARYHGIAKVDEQTRVTQLIVFHPATVILSEYEAQVVWWDNRDYNISVTSKVNSDLRVSVSRVYPSMQPVAGDWAASAE